VTVERNRLIYYVGFPLAVAALCGFSYFLGLSRGKQVGPTPAPVVEEAGKAVPHEIGSELTFFKTLKADEGGAPKSSTPLERIRKAEEVAEKQVGKGSIGVQVSAFRDIGKAHELVSELENRGFTAFVRSPKEGKGDGWYRVYVGPFSSKQDAGGALGELASKGFGSGFVTELDQR
jgi:cell division septation protein DedD